MHFLRELLTQIYKYHQSQTDLEDILMHLLYLHTYCYLHARKENHPTILIFFLKK
jgi:hypothetical protein